MFKNYLKIAFRNITKQKLYSTINIVGLTLGITCCIVIYLFIQDEYSYDRFHEHSNDIYIVEEINYYDLKETIEPSPFFDTRTPEGVRKSPWLPLSLGPVLKDRIPEIKDFVRANQFTTILRIGEDSFEEELTYADDSFFTIFSFPLLQGNPETVLSEPGSLVLTQEMASKYFGERNPVGETIFVTVRNEDKPFTVTGIAKAPPANSSTPFSIITNIKEGPFYERNLDRWNSFNTPVFLHLEEGADIAAVTGKINEFVVEKWGNKFEGYREQRGLPDDATVLEFGLVPLPSLHLNASIEWINSSNPLYSYILGAIGVLILLIACINYITLALARSSSRAKEVGIRKTSGAQKNQIALQFWGETQLLTIIAMIIGICLAEIILPYFNAISEKSLSIDYLDNAGFLIALLSIALTTGLIAGSYPALILSRYQPAKVLKGLSSFQFKPKLTKGLLVLQYSLSIFLIISSVIMFKQMDYVSGKDLGYNEEQVLFIPTHTGWNEEGTKLMELYRNELNGTHGVASVSGMAPAFTSGSNRYGFNVDGEEFRSYIYFVDEQIIPTLGFELVAGRNFSEDRPSDETESIIVNEALVSALGWENDPIGKLLPWKGQDNPSTVIGVVKDFHFQSLEVEIQPMLMHMDHSQGGVASIAVKIEPGMIGETLPQLEEKWGEISPHRPFNFWFLDDAVASQYADYQRWLQIMGAATFIAILIACLGLFGLAGLTAVNKTKEIGIRKVLGAGIDQIILLFNKDIVLLIVISMLIAAPASWYIMEQWLSDFSYRISINAGVFVISTIVALLLAVVTVSYHSVKAALANPVDSLKSE
ncbi:MAG: ABC transporter permease [Balneola sp.]